jgi:cytochrome c556
MRLITTLFISSMLLTTTPIPANSQSSTDPQQHLKIQNFAQMHGVHNDKLKSIMQRMIGSLMKQPKNKDDELRQAKYFASLVKASRKVVSASLSLDNYLAAGELSEKETTKFKVLAEELHKEALNAENQAKEGNAEELNASLNRFNQTCITCHRLFREH